jgi:hypothetical protein
MFAIVSSPCDADMYDGMHDGMHVVRLPDSPENVLQLLRTIYDSPYVYILSVYFPSLVCLICI